MDTDTKRRLLMIARGLMRGYALRWKYIRRESQDQDRAKGLLAEAVRLRRLAEDIFNHG